MDTLRQKETINHIEREIRLLRPENLSSNSPGSGLEEQDALKRFIKVKKEVTVTRDDAYATIKPFDGFKVSFKVSFDHPVHETLPSVSIYSFIREAGTQYNLLMAASLISIFPVLILYFFTQRLFLESISNFGLKQ